MAGRRKPGSFDLEVAHVLGEAMRQNTGGVSAGVRSVVRSVHAARPKPYRSCRQGKLAGTPPRALRAIPAEESRLPVVAFQPRSAAEYSALSSAAREVFSGIYERWGLVYEGGQTHLADALNLSQRTVERGLGRLSSAGFASVVRPRDRDPKAKATVQLHPDAGALITAPFVPRYEAPTPARERLSADSIALCCAAVPSWRGGRALPVSYVVALMTRAERAIVAQAAMADVPWTVCDDVALSDELIAHFRHRAALEKGAAVTRAFLQLVREASFAQDVPHHVNDDEASNISRRSASTVAALRARLVR